MNNDNYDDDATRGIAIGRAEGQAKLDTLRSQVEEWRDNARAGWLKHKGKASAECEAAMKAYQRVLDKIKDLLDDPTPPTDT